MVTVTDGWGAAAWTAAVAVVAALGALVVAGAVGYLFFRQPSMVVGAIAGAGLVAPAAWWLLVEYPGKATVARGLCAGGLTGAAAHPVMWAVWFGAGLDLGPVDGGPVRFLLGLVAYAGYLLLVGVGASLYSLLFVGWVTVPLGAVVGALLGQARERSLDAADGTDGYGETDGGGRDGHEADRPRR